MKLPHKLRAAMAWVVFIPMLMLLIAISVVTLGRWIPEIGATR